MQFPIAKKTEKKVLLAPAPQIKIKINIKVAEATTKNSSGFLSPREKRVLSNVPDPDRRMFLTIFGVKQFTAQIKINNRYADKSMELVPSWGVEVYSEMDSFSSLFLNWISALSLACDMDLSSARISLFYHFI